METAAVGGKKLSMAKLKITATDVTALLYSNRLQRNFKKHCHGRQNNSLLKMFTP